MPKVLVSHFTCCHGHMNGTDAQRLNAIGVGNATHQTSQVMIYDVPWWNWSSHWHYWRLEQWHTDLMTIVITDYDNSQCHKRMDRDGRLQAKISSIATDHQCGLVTLVSNVGCIEQAILICILVCARNVPLCVSYLCLSNKLVCFLYDCIASVTYNDSDSRFQHLLHHHRLCIYRS